MILRASILILVLSLSACTLDAFMFNQTKLTEYRFGAYEGKVDFVLDPSFSIPDSLKHLFFLPSGEGNKLIACLYIGDLDQIATDTVIFYCHGNRDHMDFYWPRAQLLANLGGDVGRYGFMYFDYFGYGMSEGSPSENGLIENSTTCLQWLKNKGLTGDRLVIYGFSLGSYPAVYHSAYAPVLKPSKLILEAPIGNTQTLVDQSNALSLPASFLMNGDFNNVANIKNCNQDLLLLHGMKDIFLPFPLHGAPILEAHSYPHATLLPPDASHGDIPLSMGFTRFLSEILTFVMN